MAEEESPQGENVAPEETQAWELDLSVLMSVCGEPKKTTLSLSFIKIQDVPTTPFNTSKATQDALALVDPTVLSNAITGLDSGTAHASEDRIREALSKEPVLLPDEVVADILACTRRRCRGDRMMAQAASAGQTVWSFTKEGLETVGNKAKEGTDAVKSRLVTEETVLGSRKLKQIAEVVQKPDEQCSEENKLLGSRRIFQVKNIIFGASAFADAGKKATSDAPEDGLEHKPASKDTEAFI